MEVQMDTLQAMNFSSMGSVRLLGYELSALRVLLMAEPTSMPRTLNPLANQPAAGWSFAHRPGLDVFQPSLSLLIPWRRPRPLADRSHSGDWRCRRQVP